MHWEQPIWRLSECVADGLNANGPPALLCQALMGWKHGIGYMRHPPLCGASRIFLALTLVAPFLNILRDFVLLSRLRRICAPLGQLGTLKF